MKRTIPLLPVLLVAGLLLCCQEKAHDVQSPEVSASTEPTDPTDPHSPDDPDGKQIDEGLACQRLEEISGDVLNPERGFYKAAEFKASSSALSVSSVRNERLGGRSLFYTQFRLDGAMSSDIPESYLNKMDATFSALREGGAKCILRFCYKENESASNKPWDAEEKWVMRHIEQVKPLLHKYEDVIMVFQAGYIGVWGEWYYTDNFIFGPSSFEDYQPRRRVLEAMLDALPESRQVAVRTPMFKMNMYGISVKDTLTALTAHNGSILSRIGAYNDCFVANDSDYGTYAGTQSRSFWQGDTRYTFMGGETCNVSSYCNCVPTLKEMAAYHWTYLNIDYNKSVHKVWKEQGCYDEILRRLGYRLVVDEVKYSPSPKDGEAFKLVLYLRNAGFSAPQNPRGAFLIFVSDKGEKTVTELGSDPRNWHPGTTRIEKTLTLPSDKGTFYLHLPDPLLPDRSEYSIRLANKEGWDPTTGYNKLLEIK